MSELIAKLCECTCKNISFELPSEPIEIAQCFCSICTSISKSEFMAFSKYSKKHKQLSELVDSDKILIFRSSNRAIRGLCNKCNDSIFMQYDNSENIWINENIFKFSHTHISTYDIFN